MVKPSSSNDRAGGGGGDAPSRVLGGRIEKPARSRSLNDLHSRPSPIPSQSNNLVPVSRAIDDLVAVEIFKELNVSNNFFTDGKMLATAVLQDDPAYQDIRTYVTNSQAPSFGVKVVSILRLQQSNGSVSFSENPKTRDEPRMMLWYLTTKEQLPAILEDELKLPPTTFGRRTSGTGIFLTDRVCKACIHSDPGCRSKWNTAPTYLLLCDVVLGVSDEVYAFPYNSTAPPVKKGSFWGGNESVLCDSVKVCGQNIPDESQQKIVEGSVWPLGPTVSADRFTRFLAEWEYNAYGVYNQCQVQAKYLVKIEHLPKSQQEEPNN